jgi:5-methylcytosine-specific restriction endonuclease McrA
VTKRLAYNDVYQHFKDNDCELLTKEYKNILTKMDYKCQCGNISSITLGNLMAGKRCMKCSGTPKFSFEHVRDTFKNRGCELLETKYEGIFTKMKYKCICGNISQICFNDFKQGQFCHDCAIGKRSGEKHYNYNPNLTDEERKSNDTRVHIAEYRKWRKEVYKRDNYICQKCLIKSRYLNAHHIENWASNRELRYKNSNGITLCKLCHNEFHRIYGKKNNNSEQINKFIKSV